MNRICFVIPSLAVGGTERQLLALVKGLARNHEVTILCTREAGALAKYARRNGAEVVVLGSGSPWLPPLFFQLEARFRHHRPDVVHSFMFGFDYWVNRAARKTGVPVVVSSRRELAVWQRHRHRWLQRRANALVDAIVCNSNAIREFVRAHEHLDPAQLHVIHNGIEPGAFRPDMPRADLYPRYGIPAGRRVVGMVANFSPVKDHPLFLRMAALLAASHPETHFLMAGSGPLRKQAEALAEELGLAGRITRVASVSAMRDLLTLMEVSVLTSRVEGFPNAVMESMAAGVPVVAAAVGGIPELVGEDTRGVLVHTRSPEDFAAAVAGLLDDPSHATALGQAAADWVSETLTVDRLVTRHRALYGELLARGARRGN